MPWHWCSVYCLFDRHECVESGSQASSASVSVQTIGTKPVAHIDQFAPEMLGTADLAEEVNLDGSGKLVKVAYSTQ